MKRLPAILCLLSSVFCLSSFGTEPTDLGQGLSYLRIRSVAEAAPALKKSVPSAPALVLDLRYATADETSAEALKTALASRAPRSTLLILVSPETAPALAPVITAAPALTLGAPGSKPVPKVTVQTDASADRQAYDALDAGTDLTRLITGRIEKERFDEASLVKEFKNGHPDPAPPGPVDPTAAKPEASGGKETPPVVPTDRVLQRAVHLHRTLIALKAR